MPDILHLVNIKTSDKTQVFNAITTPEGISGWWTTGTTIEQEENSIATFRFTPEHLMQMKITKLVRNELVEWLCVTGDRQWIGTKIKFSIETKADSINLRFSHMDWKAATDLYADCNYHWGLYLKSLKSFIENGKGNPHKYLKD